MKPKSSRGHVSQKQRDLTPYVYAFAFAILAGAFIATFNLGG